MCLAMRVMPDAGAALRTGAHHRQRYSNRRPARPSVGGKVPELSSALPLGRGLRPGRCGVLQQPLVDALKTALLVHPVPHSDETPVAMLDPGAGKTHRVHEFQSGSQNGPAHPVRETKQILK